MEKEIKHKSDKIKLKVEEMKNKLKNIYRAKKKVVKMLMMEKLNMI